MYPNCNDDRGYGRGICRQVVTLDSGQPAARFKTEAELARAVTETSDRFTQLCFVWLPAVAPIPTGMRSQPSQCSIDCLRN
jgi:hypothetical protein